MTWADWDIYLKNLTDFVIRFLRQIYFIFSTENTPDCIEFSGYGSVTRIVVWWIKLILIGWIYIIQSDKCVLSIRFWDLYIRKGRDVWQINIFVQCCVRYKFAISFRFMLLHGRNNFIRQSVWLSTNHRFSSPSYIPSV